MRILNFLSKLLNAVVTVIEIVLLIRFVFILLGVKSSGRFVGWIYETTGPLVFPFKSIFQQLDFRGFTIDITTLLSIIAFGIAGIILVKVISHPTSYD